MQVYEASCNIIGLSYSTAMSDILRKNLTLHVSWRVKYYDDVPTTCFLQSHLFLQTCPIRDALHHDLKANFFAVLKVDVVATTAV